jgi:hypothetical protein
VWLVAVVSGGENERTKKLIKLRHTLRLILCIQIVDNILQCKILVPDKLEVFKVLPDQHEVSVKNLFQPAILRQ